MMKQKIIILILMALFLVSCSKSPGKTGAKFKLSIGALVDLGASGAGGAMLWGRSDKGDMFGTVIQTSTPMQLELSNGAWTFWAVAWEGNGNTYNFQGVTRCAKSSAILNGTDAQVNINLANSTCASTDFSPSVSSNAGVYEFPKVAHYDCNKLSDHNGIGCGTNLGSKSTSRRLIMPSFKKSNGGPIVLEGSALVSACRTIGVAFTEESLPLGNGFLPVYTVLESFFSASDCNVADPKGVRKAAYEFGLLATARLDTIKFVNEGSCNPTAIPMAQCQALGGTYSASCTMSAGLQSDISQAACVTNGGSYTASTTSKKFELITAIPEFELCSGVRTNISNISPHPFASGNGTVSAPYTICKETQLNAIGLNATTYDSSHFSLQADLDMNSTSIFGDQPAPACFTDDPGANFVPIGGLHDGSCVEIAAVNYTGNFNGNGHSVSNIRLRSKIDDLGFVRKGGSISNLILNNVEIEGTANVGAVSGLGATKLENIQVNEGEVRGSNYVGGIAGKYQAMDISNVHAKKLIINLDGSSVAGATAGGIVAETSSASLYFKKSSFEGIIKASHFTGEILGGLLGTGNSGVNVYVNESFSSGVILASGTAGSMAAGLVANNVTGPVTINDSYSRMSIGPRYFKTTYGAAKLGGLVGFSGSATIVNNSYYYGSIMHPCKKTGDDCSVGSLLASSAATGSNKYGAVLSDDWYTTLPTDIITLATIESGAAKSALIATTKFKEVGSLLPRLTWESAPCSLPENNATVAAQSATRGALLAPVVLCNKEQWKEIVNYPALNYVVEDNLALGNIALADMSTTFSGTIRGKGFYVSGFKATVPSSNGGLFKANSGKLIDINFAAGVIEATGSAASVGVVGVNNVAGAIENSSFESVHVIGTPTASQGVIAGVNNGKVFNNKIDSYSEAYATSSGLAVGENSATGVVTALRVEGELRVFNNIPSNMGIGGVAGINNGLITEVESGLRIYNNLNSNSSSRIGALIGKNEGTLRDALVSPHARVEINIAGPIYGQAIGLSGASSLGERIIVANEMPVTTSFMAGAKHFVGEDLSAPSGYANSFALAGGVFEINATPLTVSNCATNGTGIDYTMNAPYNTDPSYTDGYFATNFHSDKNVSARITGTHTNSTSLLASTSSDLKIPCGAGGIQSGTVLHMIQGIADFTHTGLTSLAPADFLSMDTFCPSSTSAGSLTYKCGAGEFDIVEDSPNGIGFTRMVQTYRSIMINKTIPTDRPIWTIENGGYPRLLLAH